MNEPRIEPIDVSRVVDEHYTRLGKDYDEFLYYSPEFVRSLTLKMIEKLGLRPADRMVDLGCGTGMYSVDILKQVPLEAPVIGVDPFSTMLQRIPGEANIQAIAEDAVVFSRRLGEYDKILIKETIHHIDAKQELFANLRERLTPGGRLLLVHVPPDVKYPLFRRALDRCLGWHANPDDLVELLGEAGFRVERDALDYPHRIPKDHYFRMVRGQYMSVLSSFSEGEIEEGLAEMADTWKDRDTLEFVDHFDYLTAVKE